MQTLNRDVQQLNLASNNITSLEWREFYEKKFRNLQKINLNANKISQINRRTFYKLTGLVELDLSENLIAEFDDQVTSDSVSERGAEQSSFKYNSNLDESSSNRSEEQKRLGFNRSLRSHLSNEPTAGEAGGGGSSSSSGSDDGNSSSNYSSTFLQDLNQLRVLNLASNQLTALHKFTFSPLIQLRQLYLSR